MTYWISGSWLRERLEAKLKDPTMIDRVQAELDRHAQSNQYLGPDPPPWRGTAKDGSQLNADGTIAIKGEAAKQLKALIREVLDEREPGMMTIRDFTDAIIAAEYKRRRGVWYDQQVPGLDG